VAISVAVFLKRITTASAATTNANDAGTAGKNSAIGHTHGWTKLRTAGIVSGVQNAGKPVLTRTIGLGADAATAGRFGQSITIGPMTVLQLRAMEAAVIGVKSATTAGNVGGSKHDFDLPCPLWDSDEMSKKFKTAHYRRPGVGSS
jgi:hypothetical protein